MSNYLIPEWPYALGKPQTTGNIKTQVDDFIVEEILSFSPEGSGEHAFLFIEKAGENTEYVARLLARFAGVRQRDVSFAGLKDRHGLTRQWFSVWLPGKPDPNWQVLNSDSLQILQAVRHARKLKRGVLAGNQFKLIVRQWQGDRTACEQQLQTIKQHGFPNYFAEQRFGRNGQNLQKAVDMFQGASVKRELASIYLSAARSYLFNLILAERVTQHTWRQAIPGDVFQLNHTHSYFCPESIDEALLARLASGDIHPTAMLWGKGRQEGYAEALALEQQIIQTQPVITAGLLKAGLEMDRRALRIIPEQMTWQFHQDSLELAFQLPAGSYATALLREIVLSVANENL